MPSIGQNLQPFTGNGEVSKWVRRKIPNKQTNCSNDTIYSDRFESFHNHENTLFFLSCLWCFASTHKQVPIVCTKGIKCWYEDFNGFPYLWVFARNVYVWKTSDLVPSGARFKVLEFSSLLMLLTKTLFKQETLYHKVHLFKKVITQLINNADGRLNLRSKCRTFGSALL